MLSLYSNFENLVLPPGCMPNGQEAGPGIFTLGDASVTQKVYKKMETIIFAGCIGSVSRPAYRPLTNTPRFLNRFLPAARALLSEYCSTT